MFATDLIILFYIQFSISILYKILNKRKTTELMNKSAIFWYSKYHLAISNNKSCL